MFLHLQEGDDAMGGEGEQAPRPEEPTTRVAFNLLRQTYGNAPEMLQDFLQDHEHHVRVRMLIESGRPLQREYAYNLTAHKNGQHAMMVFQAERSKGAWFKTVKELLTLLQTPSVLGKLELRPHVASQPAELADT